VLECLRLVVHVIVNIETRGEKGGTLKSAGNTLIENTLIEKKKRRRKKP